MIKVLTIGEAKVQMKGRSKKVATANKIAKALRTLPAGKCLLVSRGEVKRLGYKSTTYSPLGALGKDARAKFTGKIHPKGWVIFRR